MFTQCPQCNTLFQLSVSQLRAANGDVRCGQCLSVFSALDHLSEEVPPEHETDTTENLAHETGEYYSGFGEIPDSMANTDEPATGPAAGNGQTDTRTHDTVDVFSEIINEVKEHDIPEEEIDRFEEFLATNTLLDEDSLTVNDSFSVENSSSAEDFLLIENPLPVEDPLLVEDSIPDAIINTDSDDTLFPDKTSTPADETNFGDIDDTVTAVLNNTDINFNDDEFAEFDAYLDGPENIPTDGTVQHIDKIHTDDDDIIVEATDNSGLFTSPARADTPESTPAQQPDANTAAPEENLQEEAVHATEGQPSPSTETHTINIPGLLLDDLHAVGTRQPGSFNTLWVTGSLLLMFTLILQVVYYSRDELVKDASLRPWLVQICETLNCTLSQPYDIKQIEIIGRDVRSHPSADEALVVSTTLINNATFVQPFPLLTMVFSDINGTKVAQRRFTPREYLSNTVDLATGMIPDMPIRIDLELVDPGKAAVNYEFHAEVDPRQTRPLT